MRLARCLFYVVALITGFSAEAQVNFAQYGVTPPDTGIVHQQLKVAGDSFLTHHAMMQGRVISDIAIPHEMVSQTADFYLLLFLCLMLGMIRFSDTRYFVNLWRAFWNPTLSNRQLKDQLQGSGFPNLLMNIFFAFSSGAYIYYTVKLYVPHHSGVIPPSLLIIGLIAGMGIIYFAKYLALRFSGWAFRVGGVTEHYLFNVFLINKVLGVTLLPFIIILAFADKQWAQEFVIISFVAAGILLLNRYFRSWQALGSFFQYSKFHFFMYLCASELLPLAVLTKLLVKGLMYY
jgi:hypothetical protein